MLGAREKAKVAFVGFLCFGREISFSCQNKFALEAARNSCMATPSDFGEKKDFVRRWLHGVLPTMPSQTPTLGPAWATNAPFWDIFGHIRDRKIHVRRSLLIDWWWYSIVPARRVRSPVHVAAPQHQHKHHRRSRPVHKKHLISWVYFEFTSE